MSVPALPAARAARALAALAIDPAGLKGMTLRARVGPVRAAFEAVLPAICGRLVRVPPSVSDVQLFGGLNIAATLAAGRPVMDPGLQDTPATLVIPMAERMTSALAARLGQILDSGRGHSLILLDEGADPDETVRKSLADRLAFFTDLSEVPVSHARFAMPDAMEIQRARNALPRITVDDAAVEMLVAVAARFGIDSPRAPIFAIRAARALAALDRDKTVCDRHVQEAAELVFAARAEIVPETNEEPHREHPAEREDGKTPEDSAASQTPPADMLVDAVAALLPPDVLERARQGARAKGRGSSGGAGLRKIGNRRGRPLPSHPGKPDGRNRIDAIATLRAAAPWQGLRRAHADPARPILIYPSDIRIRRFETHSDRLLIFTVDASGSSAIARLSEAKGAVEILLAQAYAKRDQVALIAFRGQTAELLLPPTRSLVQGKRRLAALPGGGGTPLAMGLQLAAAISEQARRRGMSPVLALLTDGRANIALDGTADRGAALSDASRIARGMRQDGIESAVIDISHRRGAEAAELAQDLGARYVALPRADAHAISSAVDAATGR